MVLSIHMVCRAGEFIVFIYNPNSELQGKLINNKNTDCKFIVWVLLPFPEGPGVLELVHFVGSVIAADKQDSSESALQLEINQPLSVRSHTLISAPEPLCL